MKIKIQHVVALLGVPVLVAFQNCGKTNFQNLNLDPSGKITGVQEPNPGALPSDMNTLPTDSTGTGTGTVSSSDPSAASGKSKLDDDEEASNKQWELESYSRLGQNVELPKREFRIHLLKKAETGEVNCAGDCGESYRIIGQAYCGAFKGYYQERFDESAGEVLSHIKDASAIANASDSRCTEDEKLLDSEILAQLAQSFSASLKSAGNEVTLRFSDGSIMVFERKNSDD